MSNPSESGSELSLSRSIAAVIVTFNRLEKLKKVMDALAMQSAEVAQIFVVDNASTDGTKDYLSELEKANPRIVHVRLPQNIGGAGGFFEGAKAAYASGYDYIWFSDDDAYPEPDAIAALTTAIEDFKERFVHQPSFACSAVKWVDGALCEMNTPSPVWDWPRFYSAQTPYFLVSACSFVSVLVPRKIFEVHGFPIKDYFIWYDDAEFTQRIAKSYPGIYVPESRVIHDVPENKGVNYALINDGNIWKFEYGARNEASFRRREQGWPGVAIFARGVFLQMQQGKVNQSLRRRVYKAIWKGARWNPPIVRPESQTSKG